MVFVQVWMFVCFCLVDMVGSLSVASLPEPDDAFKAMLMRHTGAALDAPSSARQHRPENSSQPVHLLTSIFLPEPAKQNGHVPEIMASVFVNIRNPLIASVHVLLESYDKDCAALQQHLGELTGKKVEHKEKVVCTVVNRIPTYHDFFQYANNNMRDKLVLLSNADVVFDFTLANVGHLSAGVDAHVISVQPPPYSGEYASMFNINCESTKRCIKHTTSWDAYLFVAPLPSKLDDFNMRFPMNMQHAENYAASALGYSGLNLKNACGHIGAYHWHCIGGKMHSDWAYWGTPSWRWDEGKGTGFGPCRDFPGDCERENHCRNFPQSC